MVVINWMLECFQNRFSTKTASYILQSYTNIYSSEKLGVITFQIFFIMHGQINFN